MNVVNARAAALGDTLANILKNAGNEVIKEYYINDSGVQVNNLGLSVESRMRELNGQKVEFPENGYHGDYIIDIANVLLNELGDCIWNKEPTIRLDILKNRSLTMMVSDQRMQLENYGVKYDIWFSEKSLHEKKALENTLETLKIKGRTYEHEGALWLKTSEFGDDKDRVLIKEDGQPTYFLADIAYHENKFSRNFDLVIDILGPDHHGHGIRMKAAMEALGYDPNKLMILIVQQVNLKRSGEIVKMSKRAGEFVTLDELIREVGKDAARFFFLMRKAESHLDFDIDLAKKTSNENPVYYVQYAHARIASILKKAEDEGINIEEHPDDSVLSKLELQEEIELIKKLYDYQEVIDKAALFFEPHRLSVYLIELAGMFHSYYKANRVISDDPRLTSARIYLLIGIKIIIKNALTLMGINAPESM
jgi:arginyl-tRNA synthetase